ncbi:hypothetical protein K9F62_07820 [Desulfovibrio sp. JY]|nr:hypothetical protein K9F62_07820 [Desulfovibrio sp. JY]
MTKSYLLCKCTGEDRIPLVVFTADNVDEAREAPTWLRRKHPDHPGLRLEPGEFFEILEKDLCPADEWDAALARIHAEKPASKQS